MKHIRYKIGYINIMDDTNDASIIKIGSSDYLYTINDIEYNIGVKNHLLLNQDEYSIIISNYFISGEDKLCIFATIIWDDIKYENEDYNPYNYDPDPIMILYRDDLPKELEEKYLTMIDQISNKYYKPTTDYKHFNPQLPKVKLSEFSDVKYECIANEFKSLIECFTFLDDENDENDE